MRVSTLLISALLGTAAAAPSFPELNVRAAGPASLETLSNYFNMLAVKVQEGRVRAQAPVCDMSKAALPGVSTLPPVTSGLVLKHVAVGRGTQNYTCDASNSSAIPVLYGAKATLFNASCVASTYPSLLNMLPRVALQFNISTNGKAITSDTNMRLPPTDYDASGIHYFLGNGVPFFSLDSDTLKLGEMPSAKNSTMPAPTDAPKGQKGENAVPWLKLLATEGATGGLQEVYRVETAGGSAPAKCEGMPERFEVEYSAQYWFFGDATSQP